MAPDPDRDIAPGDGRDETESERLDRNWDELLQELRVTQTGTQILTGFLLTLPFQQRFAELDETQRAIYLALVAFAVVATILALAPVALHRGLFRQRSKKQIVHLGNRLVVATVACVALTVAGTTTLIVSVVQGDGAGWVAGAVSLAVAVAAWVLLPRAVAARRRVGDGR